MVIKTISGSAARRSKHFTDSFGLFVTQGPKIYNRSSYTPSPEYSTCWNAQVCIYMFVWYRYSQFCSPTWNAFVLGNERKPHFFESPEYRGTKLTIWPSRLRSQIFSEIKHLTSSSHSVVIYQELEPNVTWIHILWSQCGVIPLVLIRNIVWMWTTWKHG